jgi:hypothetical protein
MAKSLISLVSFVLQILATDVICKDDINKILKTRAGGMAQVVEYLTSKHEAKFKPQK